MRYDDALGAVMLGRQADRKKLTKKQKRRGVASAFAPGGLTRLFFKGIKKAAAKRGGKKSLKRAGAVAAAAMIPGAGAIGLMIAAAKRRKKQRKDAAAAKRRRVTASLAPSPSTVAQLPAPPVASIPSVTPAPLLFPRSVASQPEPENVYEFDDPTPAEDIEVSDAGEFADDEEVTEEENDLEPVMDAGY